LAILSILRLMAIATVLGLGGMVFIFWRRDKSKSAILK
jgi:hypothetical protein